MGLGFSHGGARWAYSGFMRFRTALAEHEGIDLMQMDGYRDGGRPWDDIESPLLPLLAHSDCDGEMPPDECRAVAAELRRLVPEVFTKDGLDYQSGLALAAGMEQAAAEGVPIEFM